MNDIIRWSRSNRVATALALGVALATCLMVGNGVAFPGPEGPAASAVAPADLAAPDLATAPELPRLPRPLVAMPAEADFRRFSPIIERASRAYGVDAALVHAVIMAESSFDPDALSPAGASGLMQLMPATARHYGVHDPFEPQQNIHGGVRCLRDLLQQFDGDVELAVAAYNAGAWAVIRAGKRIPPNSETVAYVPRVIDFYHHFRARMS